MFEGVAPKVLAGDYSVELSAGGQVQTQSFSILPDPRLPISADDLKAQYELKVAIRDRISEAHETLNALDQIRGQANDWAARANSEEITQAAEALSEKISTLEDQFRISELHSRKGGENGLREKLGVLSAAIDESDHAPTAQAQEVYGNLAEDVASARYQVQRLSEDDVAAFTAKLTTAGVPLISAVPTAAGARAATGD
jgi:hypothetical protein